MDIQELTNYAIPGNVIDLYKKVGMIALYPIQAKTYKARQLRKFHDKGQGKI